MQEERGYHQMSDTTAIANDARHALPGGEEESVVCPICGGDEVRNFLEAPDRFHLRRETYRLVHCGACSAVWLATPPKPEDMSYHYTKDYHQGIVAAGEGFALSRWKNQSTLISRLKKGGAILDIGCSSGGFLSTMKGPSWDLYGIEMEEWTAERARTNSGAKVFVGDAVEAPFLPASFDVITAFDVLEHVYSPGQFLTKVIEWLKPGGIFYAMLPNIDSWEAKLFGSYWYGLELPRHLSHFSPRSLRYLMTTLGFEEVLLRTPPISYAERSIGYLYSSLLETLGGSPTPQAKPRRHSLPWRAVRKGIRLAVITPTAQVASSAGAGPSMEVVFRKPDGMSRHL